MKVYCCYGAYADVGHSEDCRRTMSDSLAQPHALPFVESIATNSTSGEAVVKQAQEIEERLRAPETPRGDAAYCAMIAQARRTECLGWEAKVRAGTFGKAELDAHVRCGELYGKHLAYTECEQEIRRLERERDKFQALWGGAAQRGDELATEVSVLNLRLAEAREALRDAAQSLETIATLAGKDKYLDDFIAVRGYANSRASVARAALREEGSNG